MSAFGGGLRLSAAVVASVLVLATASAGGGTTLQALQDRAGSVLAGLPLPSAEPPSPAPAAPPEPTPAPPVQAPALPDAAATAAGTVAAARDEAARRQQELADRLDPLLATLEEGLHKVRRTAEDPMALLAPPAPEDPQEADQPALAGSDATLVAIPPILALSAAVAGVAAAGLVSLWLAGSTSGASAAGPGGSALSRDLRRLLPFASPLFTRFERDTVLGHPRREALYALILQQPGVSLQALGAQTGLSRTAVLHHLRLLEQQHLVVSIRKGRNRHYYENGGRFGVAQKDAYAVLQNERSRQVADFVRANPGTLQKALCAALAIQPSIAHWHVRRLQEARLIEAVHQGRTVSYFPAAALSGMPRPAAAPAPAPAAAPPAPVALPMPVSA